VLRCGGGVKFKHLDKWMWDYNAIPDRPIGKLALEGINAQGISITTGGLQHLGNISFVKFTTNSRFSLRIFFSQVSYLYFLQGFSTVES